MKVAIVGAGLSGLSVAWKLLETKKFSVTLFDAQGVGGGASGVASGLMHPYAGEQARRSHFATEGLMATRHLLAQVEHILGSSVASYDGIVRVIQNAEQERAFESHRTEYGDVALLGNGHVLIRSGVTVYCQRYLQGLWEMIRSSGGRLEQVLIQNVDGLSDFDAIVIAAGFGVSQFAECRELPLKFTKGQVLFAQAPQEAAPLKHSLIGKGYIALGENPGEYHLGSTYERGFTSASASLETAKSLILPNVLKWFPEAEHWKMTGCRAGVRVIRSGDYFPIVQRLNQKCWVVTALGSRGLLYHALLADQLVSQLCSHEP